MSSRRHRCRHCRHRAVVVVVVVVSGNRSDVVKEEWDVSPHQPSSLFDGWGIVKVSPPEKDRGQSSVSDRPPQGFLTRLTTTHRFLPKKLIILRRDVNVGGLTTSRPSDHEAEGGPGKDSHPRVDTDTRTSTHDDLQSQTLESSNITQHPRRLRPRSNTGSSPRLT